MLFKFFGSRHHNIPLNPDTNSNTTPSYGRLEAVENSLIIKIIHVGGVVETYYMAFPAAWIIDKYPNLVLARPEIFRRPWDSVVPPEEILVPGEKYFLVPVPTVKKLRRRMKKLSIDMSNGLIYDKDTSSYSRSLTICKSTPVSRHVRFIGIESKTKNDSSVVDDKRKKKKKKKKNLFGKGLRKKNVRFTPSLIMIDETEGSED